MIADDLAAGSRSAGPSASVSAIACSQRLLDHAAPMVAGTVTTELAKITGMTPPVLTRSGR